MITKKFDYDIIIIGGGVVGMTLAGLLPNELRIAIIENQTPHNKNSGKYDLRVSAINHFSQSQFTACNAWSAMQSHANPFHEMFVWDKKGKGEINFDCFAIAQPNLGYIIENRVMQNALFQSLPHIDFIAPAQPHAFTSEENGIVLTLQDGRQLRTRLLVGADGANSWVRDQAKIELRQWSYQQQALVTTVKTELPHQRTARQVFLPDGVLAFLPLADQYHCSIVWSANHDTARQLQQMSDEQFNEAITQAFENRLGMVQTIDRLLSFPLVMRHAKQYIQSNIALLGDAIHTIHPLAGQGINLGIADAQCLATTITTALQKNRDFAAQHNLRRYERERRGSNWLMIGMMEGFKRLFSSNFVNTRSLGLNAVNKTSILKNFFIRNAVG